MDRTFPALCWEAARDGTLQNTEQSPFSGPWPWAYTVYK
jgi:hypothetical protein